MINNIWAQLILCLFAGFLYALGFPSFLGESLFITPIIGFAIYLYQVLNCSSFKQRALRLLFFSAGFNFLGFYWIPKTINTFGGIPLPIAWLLGTFFTFIILPQQWIFIFIVKKLERIKDKNLFYFSCAVALTLLEYLTPQQFPAHIGHSWLLIPATLGMASIFGSIYYHFLSYFIVFNIISYVKEKKLNTAFAIFSIILIALTPINIYQSSNQEQTLPIRVVQANIGNFVKTNAENGGFSSMQQVFDRYYNLSTKVRKTKAELIIWPETAYPYAMYGNEIKNSAEFAPQLIRNIIQSTKTKMLIGGYDKIKGSGAFDYFSTEYNSALYFNENSTLSDVYHKQKLIPFGETLPFPNAMNRFISKHLDAVSFFARGDRHTFFKLKQHQFITPICYEILFPEFIREYLNAEDTKPDFMINLTNDSWYGDTSEPFQHLFLSKWRAAEFKLPIVRSTNTGITSVIYPDTSESKRLLIGKKTTLDLDLKLKKYPKTIFQKLGTLPIFILWGLFFLVLFIQRRKAGLE